MREEKEGSRENGEVRRGKGDGAWRRETGEVLGKREKGLFGNILDYKLF